MVRPTAPYNFAPLSKLVWFPDWASAVSRDQPFEDGVCGEFELVVTARTPILIGERSKDGESKISEVAFVRTPQGEAYLPGSSLRGMIRNVVEIASFGKLCRVDDKRFGVRDLTPGVEHIYQHRITEQTRTKVFVSKVRSGFLRLREDQQDRKNSSWEIVECRYARVDHSAIIPHGIAPTELKPSNNKAGSRRAGYENHDRFAERGRKAGFEGVEVWFDDRGPEEKQRKKGNPIRMIEAPAIFPSESAARDKGVEAPVRGTLVFTGTITNKHREFIFFSPDGKGLPISEKAFHASREIHSARAGVAVGAGSEGLWDEWQRRYFADPLVRESGIPVFFIASTGTRGDVEVESFGFAQLPKMAYPLSVHDMIANTSHDHFEDRDDLAELIFGTVRVQDDEKDKKKTFARQGRVSFDHALIDEETEANDEPILCVLNGPKASYYPFYVEQNTRNGSEADRLRTNGAYRSYLWDEHKNAETGEPPEIRGWKRYLARESVYRKTPPDGGDATKSRLHPLKAGAVFRGKVRFHNLRPQELGALLWAIGFGETRWGPKPQSTYMHGLGMGKPLGLGAVELRVGAAVLRLNAEAEEKSGGDAERFLDDCMTAFVDTMEAEFESKLREFHPGLRNAPENACWIRSEQIVALRAMAKPASTLPATGQKIGYMTLEVSADGEAPNSEFQIIKGRKDLPSYALPRAFAPNARVVRETEAFPREQKISVRRDVRPPAWLRKTDD